MTERINLKDLQLNEMEKLLQDLGEPKFRAKQVFDAIIQGKDYAETTLPKQMIDELKQNYIIKPLEIFKVLESKDGTKKYLLKLYDNNLIECVFLKQDYGNTICMSTQVGCRMGCKFCASTLNGRIRDLTAGEMLSTIAVVNADNGKKTERNFSNIVLMGSGEPFDNYDNVMRFIRICNDQKGLAIGARHITVSTSGLASKIVDYSKEGLQVNLAISLHASNDETRNKIMPINKAYPLNKLFDAIREYSKNADRRVTIEYILLKGINDSLTNADELVELLNGTFAYVNLIPYNEVKENEFKRSEKKDVRAFYERLKSKGVNVTIRKEFGTDIDAACGQLRAKKEGVISE
jgi:23S rRNA (adenine2503-C2)-methyltransferase